MTNPQTNQEQGGSPEQDQAPRTDSNHTAPAGHVGPDAEQAEQTDQAAQPNPPEDAQATIDRLQRQRDDFENKFLRATADYQNFQRRAQQNVTQARQEQVRDMAKNLVTVMDHFDRALAVDPETSSTVDVLKGLNIVYGELIGALNRVNVQRIEAQPGEPFDPNRHEAMMRTPHDSYETNHVVQQFLPGYALNDQPIRPAQVSVAE